MIKKYFQTITLFTILAFLLLTALITVAISHQPAELKSDILYKISVGLLVVLVADTVMKLVLRLKTIWLWVLQIFLLLVAVYAWIIQD